MTLVNTSSSARLKRLRSRREMPWPRPKASSSAATRGMEASSLATLSDRRSPATPRSMLEAETDALLVAVGLGGEPARQPPDDDRGEPRELAVVGQQLVVVGCGGRGAERLAAILRRHLEPVFVERHGELGAGARLDQQLERLDGLD